MTQFIEDAFREWMRSLKHRILVGRRETFEAGYQAGHKVGHRVAMSEGYEAGWAEGRAYGIRVTEVVLQNKDRSQDPEVGDTYYNHGSTPIYISQDIVEDPHGGPGCMDSKILVLPGAGIDVSLLGLRREKP